MLDDVECNGTESDITSCGHRGLGLHDCRSHEQAGVICMGKYTKLTTF